MQFERQLCEKETK